MSQASTQTTIGDFFNPSGWGNSSSKSIMDPSPFGSTLKNNPWIWAVGLVAGLALVGYVLLKERK